MIQYNDTVSYEILENGYKIYNNGRLWIEQLDDYSKPYDYNKTYEENCLIQLENIFAPPTPDPTEQRISELEDAVIELASLVG